MITINETKLHAFYIEIANKLGASHDEAQIWAKCMVRADLRGMYTQGAAIIPYSIEIIEKRLAKFGVPFTILKDEPGMALVDGEFGVGAIVATRGMQLAIDKARRTGVGCVWVRNGGDFMMAANHTLQAIEQDMVGIAMRNGYPAVSPWGGKEPFFGTNPISVGVPTQDEPPIVIDMASGSFSVGQVVMAARDSRLLPSMHLVNEQGTYTNDPKDIVNNPSERESSMKGGIVTLGHKGLAWILIAELFTGLLAGSNTSNLNNYKPTAENPHKEETFLMAIDVSKLQPLAEFKASADRFVRALRSVKPAEGFERVLSPGQIEAENEVQRKKEGIPIRDEVWEQIMEITSRMGIKFKD
jgi:LDH2 family malate/lactate/ureidoglycolate dehydrogenase